MLRFITSGVLLLGLAACGGGGGGAPVTENPPLPPNTPTPPPVSPLPDSDLEDARQALVAVYANPTVYTPLSSIPTSGRAVYDGYLAGQLANTTDTITDTLIGALRMDVRFRVDGATISGTVSGFIDDDSTPLTGELTLGQGSLDRGGSPSSDATLLVTASGTLTDDAGRALVMGTQLEGDFLADDHRAVGGEVLGRISVNGQDQNFDGGFIGAR